MGGGHIRLEGLSKRFGEVVAVDGIDLEIHGGELFSLLGPSGCGKTTTLRLIAGFEQPSAGRILLDGADLARIPPHKRPVNTVFQSYALFPFLTVEENVAFGLRYRDTQTRREAKHLVAEALALVRLQGLERRRPAQLSGGQQQRVALARALVLSPAVLLLDEPLGALDAKLRKTLQLELKALQESVGITFLYVTHDQEEALTMSDRLAVMSAGRIEQVGTPAELYEEPATAFVADFLGTANLMEAVASADGTSSDGCCRVRLAGADLRASAGATTARGPVKIAIRPERVLLEPPGTAGENRLPGTVERVVYRGHATELLVRLASDAAGTLQVLLPNQGGPCPWPQGAPVTAHLPPAALRVLASG